MSYMRIFHVDFICNFMISSIRYTFIWHRFSHISCSKYKRFLYHTIISTQIVQLSTCLYYCLTEHVSLTLSFSTPQGTLSRRERQQFRNSVIRCFLLRPGIHIYIISYLNIQMHSTVYGFNIGDVFCLNKLICECEFENRMVNR